ncbi:hypothetical protein TNCT_688631 [Trichonephila clavata]|uniref:Uncharacterized protein n=1 Tax=Trichonephila clavata TaxID=2740835 RepID=A0A8X6FUI9_TRICU|nr:hypothetical protein TNCT_688631 [Trichonephila clavata]
MEAQLRPEDEARHIAEEIARLKAEEEAKAEERRKVQEEIKMNERITLDEERRLEKERWLVQEQMQHVQEEHKMRMKAAKQKCLQEERCKRMEEQQQFLNEDVTDLSVTVLIP